MAIRDGALVRVVGMSIEFLRERDRSLHLHGKGITYRRIPIVVMGGMNEEFSFLHQRFRLPFFVSFVHFIEHTIDLSRYSTIICRLVVIQG